MIFPEAPLPNSLPLRSNTRGATRVPQSQFPPGVYNITSELAKEAQRKVMMREYGENPQPVMFNPRYEYTRGLSINGLHDCVIDAYGALFLVDGFMEPVSITNCSNVEVRGFTVDHKRKPYSKATITDLHLSESGTQWCTLEFEEPIFKETFLGLRALFYDPEAEKVLRGPYIAETRFVDEYHASACILGGNVHNGIEVYIVHAYHSRPAILIEHSMNITLTDVTVNSQPGMGVVGNRCENITLTRLSVVPSRGHHMSTNTDATHFTSIKGKLKLKDCRFVGQGDDFVNVHAYYHAIVRRDAPNICYLQEKTPDGTHSQTLDYPDVGDLMELSSMDTLATLDTYKVIEVVPMPDEWMCKVVLDHDLPEITEGLAMADITRLPDVEITGCYAAEHFARSILIKTRSAIIEGNIFRDVFGTAIAISSEANWFEGVNPAKLQFAITSSFAMRMTQAKPQVFM